MVSSDRIFRLSVSANLGQCCVATIAWLQCHRPAGCFHWSLLLSGVTDDFFSSHTLQFLLRLYADISDEHMTSTIGVQKHSENILF